MIFKGDGRIDEVVGSYSDWVRSGGSLTEREKPATQTGTSARPPVNGSKRSDDTSATPTAKVCSKKLSYKEQRELEQQLALIEQLEGKQKILEARISDPEFYTGDRKRRDDTLKDMAEIQGTLEQAYARWEELEARRE
jgi:ATP-binding cassette subfamily F protein uup